MLKTRWIWIVAAMVALLAAAALVLSTEDTADVQTATTATPAPVVTVLQVDATDVTAQISRNAELRPRWQAEIRAAVSGRVKTVEPAALEGTRVEAGAALITIEPSAYEAAVASAELALEEARLALLKADNQVTVNRRQFERSRQTPPNDLALGLPEKRIAERAVASAEAQLRAARQQLADTQVTAPFAGIVRDRFVSPGQSVSAGEALVQLADDRSYELVVELGTRDWALLDHPIAGKPAALYALDGTALATADIRQGGGFLDPKTRQHRVFLQVEAGADLLGGDFVSVRLPGRVVPRVLMLPESAMTRGGHLWFVDDAGHLRRETPQILFRRAGEIAVNAPADAGPWQVAVTPLASFLPGQKVTPKAED